MPDETPVPATGSALDQLFRLADVAAGVSFTAARWTIRGGRAGARLAAPALPAAQWVFRPSYVDDRYWPESVLGGVASRGREEWTSAVAAVKRAVLALVPEVLDAALDEVDLTTLVIERVDIDEVVKHVDLDAAAEQIDIQAILDRVDLIRLARFIIDGVDLPQIIRDSTGSMASEGVRGVRVQTMDADERVGRLVDRVLLRRRDRQADTTVTGLVPEQALPEQRAGEPVQPSHNGDSPS